MGLLKEGGILEWNQIKKIKKEIKKNGAKQFVEIYYKFKSIVTDTKAFGEEIETLVVKKDDGIYKLYCGGEKTIDKLEFCSLKYGRYMVEVTSVVPYNEKNLMDVERKLIKRIKKIYETFDDGQELIMLPCYPNFSFNHFYDVVPFKNDITMSQNFPDNAITSHEMFSMLTKNIRSRRGRKIEGYVAVMIDRKSHIAAIDHTRFENDNSFEENSETKEPCSNSDDHKITDILQQFDSKNYILVDCMGQGMGCCGLQVTIQGRDMEKTRYMYDMLTILSPLLLRLSRGTPIAQGRLLNTETRWEFVEISVDCRTDEERGFKSIVSGLDDFYPYTSQIPKSRFSPVDLFISNNISNLDEYNNTYVPVDTDTYYYLTKNGVDEKMAKHVASLFIRDPVISYLNIEENIVDDFENIQTSNWRSVRFKIPNLKGPDNLRGWKNELRSMDVQATPFENSAFILFSYLLAHAVVKYNINLYIPISYVDANFKRAHKFIRNPEDFYSRLDEDQQKFYYRVNMDEMGDPIITEGTLKDIFLGTDNSKGLLYYVELIIKEDFNSSKKKLKTYIDYIKGRLDGKYISLSEYIRRFVILHDKYSHDSIVNDDIIRDLLVELLKIREKNEIDYLLNE